MATDTFKTMITGIVIIVLFSFLLIFFAISGGNRYERDVRELEGSRLNITGLNRTLQSAQETSEDWKESFQSQNLFSVVAGIVVSGIFGIAKTMWFFVTDPLSLFIAIMTDVLYIPPIITGVIIFVVIVTFILGIWSLLKKGD